MASSRSKEPPTPVCCHRLGAFMIEGCRCRFSPELVRAVMGGPWRAAPFTLNTPACVRGLEPREMYLSRTTPENHSTRQARMPCRTIDSKRHEPQKGNTCLLHSSPQRLWLSPPHPSCSSHPQSPRQKVPPPMRFAPPRRTTPTARSFSISSFAHAGAFPDGGRQGALLPPTPPTKPASSDAGYSYAGMQR